MLSLSQDVTGPEHTVQLALALVELRRQPYMTQKQVKTIVQLWARLPEQDQAAAAGSGSPAW